MANAIVTDLRAKSDAAWANLTRQLQGMEPHLDRAFSSHDLPLSETTPGQSNVAPERQKMTLKQLLEALDAQRREVLEHLEGLSEADLQARKARIPFLKQFLGTDEIALARYAGLLFDVHWNEHAGQLAKIRKAVGL